MKRVGDLFKKYQLHFKPPQATVEKAFVEAVLKVAGFKIDKKSVSYTVSTKTIGLNVPSILKSELRFKHEDILKELRQVLGDKEAPTTIL